MTEHTEQHAGVSNNGHRPTSSCLSGTAYERAEAIVRRCGGGHEGKKGWIVHCPAHDDRHPSLHVTAAEDRVLLHCYVGCEVKAIVEAIAITLSDLFVAEWQPPEIPRQKPQKPQRKLPPEGCADPVALAFAVDLVIDDVEMLTVTGLVETLKQASTSPLQWLWVERAFQQAGMTPEVVWQVLYPHAEEPYPSRRAPTPTGAVQIQGRPLPSVRLGETRHE